MLGPAEAYLMVMGLYLCVLIPCLGHMGVLEGLVREERLDLLIETDKNNTSYSSKVGNYVRL